MRALGAAAPALEGGAAPARSRRGHGRPQSLGAGGGGQARRRRPQVHGGPQCARAGEPAAAAAAGAGRQQGGPAPRAQGVGKRRRRSPAGDTIPLGGRAQPKGRAASQPRQHARLRRRTQAVQVLPRPQRRAGASARGARPGKFILGCVGAATRGGGGGGRSYGAAERAAPRERGREPIAQWAPGAGRGRRRGEGRVSRPALASRGSRWAQAERGPVGGCPGPMLRRVRPGRLARHEARPGPGPARRRPVYASACARKGRCAAPRRAALRARPARAILNVSYRFRTQRARVWGPSRAAVPGRPRTGRRKARAPHRARCAARAPPQPVTRA